MLSVKSGRQKPINGKSQNVFDFIEVNGSLYAQVIEIIEHLNRDYSHELYGYPVQCAINLSPSPYLEHYRGPGATADRRKGLTQALEP